MGLLSLGTPLDWADAAELAEQVRAQGIDQFLETWRTYQARKGDPFLWGDELEYMMVALDPVEHTARLSLRQGEILQVLQSSKASGPLAAGHPPTFHPEYGRYMLESTPGAPFGCEAADLLCVEGDMLLRRQIARANLRPNEVPMTITSFPRLGVQDAPFTDPAYEAHGDASHSMFLPDEIINTHVRFPTLTANIRKRRGSKVRINVPIYHDTNTPRPFKDPSIPYERTLFEEDVEAKLGAALPDHIYMDAMGFGMGCCCLQVTMQAEQVGVARTMYDRLIPLTPLLLAVSAGSPAYRGLLADVDCRWDVISGAVDDRTNAERGEAPLKAGEPVHTSPTGPLRLRKSRYDSVDSYLSPQTDPRLNDVDLEVDEGIRAKLIGAGIDPLLAQHVAHLFVRDPIVIFSERTLQDSVPNTDDFENLQTTNWQTMRFKPPPPGGAIGWRVEFRPMEIQLTDFENAAFSVFVVLLTRAIQHFAIDLTLPISQVDVNMQRAQKRDAVHTQKFHFRTPSGHGEYTLPALFHGTDDFEGLVPIVHRFMDTMVLSEDERRRLQQYLELVGSRADGTLMTTATWMRRFIAAHPAYKHDSVISEELTYDVCPSYSPR